MVSGVSHSQPSLVLGVDGGNTKTIAIVATSEGVVLGAGRAGPSDMYNAVSETAALNEVRAAVTRALDSAGVDASHLAIGAFSMAGADWPEDFTFLNDTFRDFGFGRVTHVVNDAIGALRAGTPDGVGVAVVLGTGIAIGARNAQGDIWYTGHWPVATGGAELGNRGLQAVYEGHLGLGPTTSLEEGVLGFFGVATAEDALHRCTARGFTRSQLEQARLAPIILDYAARGDEVALSIVREAGARNARVALFAARTLGLEPSQFRLVLAGGVLRHPSGLLRRAIRDYVKTEIPGVTVVDDAPEPVVGAVLLAMDVGEMPSSCEVRDRIVATLPGRELFET
jgi:N-acetylglucosamine kinase-like BadF-type ATPase